MAIAKGFLPFMMGMCLAIAFSSLSISFYEQVCTFQTQSSLRSDRESGAFGRQVSSELESADDSEDDRWVYYVPPLENEDDFEPHRTVPNVTASPGAKVHVKRPVFLADELGLKRKLLVVVYSRKDGSDVALLGTLNATLIEAAKREDTFYEKTVHFVLVAAPSDASDADYQLLRHFSQYYAAQVVDTYEWFFVARTSTYVSVNRLLDLVTLRLSEQARTRIFGVWSDVNGTQNCRDGLGLLVSAEVLKDLHSKPWHSAVDTAAFVQSRCADLRTELQYSEASGFLQELGVRFAALDSAIVKAKLDGTYDYHGDAQPSLDANSGMPEQVVNEELQALRSVLMHEQVQVVHNVTSSKEYLAVHKLCLRMDLLNIESRIDELRRTLAESWQQSPYAEESRSWALGTHHVPAPRTRFDVLPYHYFNDSHVFFRNELSVLEALSENEQAAINEHIEQTISLSGIAMERVINWTLVNGYRRFDPVRGVEFITDLDIHYWPTGNQKQKQSSSVSQFVRRRIESVRPLSKPQLVPTPFASESSRVTVVLFVHLPPTQNEPVSMRALFDPDIDAASFLHKLDAKAFADFEQVLKRGENSYVRTAAQNSRTPTEVAVANAVQAVEQAGSLLCGPKKGNSWNCAKVSDSRLRFLFVLQPSSAFAPVRRAVDELAKRVPHGADFLSLLELPVEPVRNLSRPFSPAQLVDHVCARSLTVPCVLRRAARLHAWFKEDSLVLHATDNAVLSNDFLNRVRVHTMRAFQVYAPVGFQYFHPEWSRDDLFDALDMHLHPRLRQLHQQQQAPTQAPKGVIGRIDQLKGPFVVQQARGFFDTETLFDADASGRDSLLSFYMSDLQVALDTLAKASLQSSESDHLASLSLFQLFSSDQILAAQNGRKPLHVFRPVEPTLFLRYRVKLPCSFKDKDWQRRCEQNRANSLTTNPKLARLVTFVSERLKSPATKPIKSAASKVTLPPPPPLQMLGGSPELP